MATSPGLNKFVASGIAALLALLLWSNRASISSWFASSWTASIQLTTLNEKDDTRLQRAFTAARAAQPGQASLELLPGLRQIRDAVVRISAASGAEAINAAQAFSRSMVATFDGEGPGHLQARVRTRAEPIAGSGNQAALAILTFAAPALGFVAAALGWAGWRASQANPATRFPRGVGLAVAASLVLATAPFVVPGWVIAALFAMAIPGAIAGAIFYQLREVRRTAMWPSAQGRIVHARTRAVRRKRPDGSTMVSNALDIEYAYRVDGVEHRGRRIGLGAISPGSAQVEAALDRYQVGSTGPVYYNPDNPEEAVLERDPPLSPSILFAIAIGVLLAGFAIVITFTRVSDIVGWLEPFFPPGAFVPGFLFCAAAAVVVLLSLLSSRRAVSKALRWPTTAGIVLSSTVVSRRVFAPGRGGQVMQVWAPLVEYSYRVGERDYHSARVAFGADVSGGRDLAEKTAARYPVGSAVAVHYDPDNPSMAVLETQVALGWLTLALVVAFFAAALFFSGWA